MAAVGDSFLVSAACVCASLEVESFEAIAGSGEDARLVGPA